MFLVPALLRVVFFFFFPGFGGSARVPVFVLFRILNLMHLSSDDHSDHVKKRSRRYKLMP
jgi:hypothetical protein